MPQANSTTSRPRCTSPLASETTLPCSSEMISGSSPVRALSSSRKPNITFARWLSDDCDQVSNAVAAVRTASSTSAAVASTTSACCSPVAGFHTGLVRVELPAVGLPPIQWVMVFNFSSCAELSLRGAGDGSVGWSEVETLAGPLLLVGLAGLLGRVEPRDSGHRHVPPRLGGRDRRPGVGLDIDDGGAL